MTPMQDTVATYGILQCDFAQERPVQVIEGASAALPQGEVLETLKQAMSGTGLPAKVGWVCVLLDAAVNEDLFIHKTKGEAIHFGSFALEHGGIFKSAAMVYDAIPDASAHAALWDAAVDALEKAAQSLKN